MRSTFCVCSSDALDAKPHAPSTSARTEKPRLSESLKPLTTPLRTSRCSSRTTPKRTSAYVAPRATAVSIAACASDSKEANVRPPTHRLRDKWRVGLNYARFPEGDLAPPSPISRVG